MASSGGFVAAPAAQKGGWTAAIFIILVEIAERFSFYGITSILITYLTTALGEPTATAAKNVNVWQGVAFLLPLIGAYVADALLGRYKTTLFASIVYLSGLVLLFLSAAVFPVKLRGPFVYLSLYIMAVGQGGHKPSVQTFAADQFSESTTEEKAAKSSFFNWWYFGVVVGASLGIGSGFMVQKNAGWLVAFSIPAMAMLVALVLFVTGARFYRREESPAGSPFTQVVQVFVAAARKWRVKEDRWGIYFGQENEVGPFAGNGAHRRVIRTQKLRWLDKAMVMDENDAMAETKDPWRLCTLHQVEEVKQVLKVLPIWFTCLSFSLIYAQFFTYFTKQAMTMKTPSLRKIQIPPPYIPFFTTTSLILIFLVIYEKLFVPIARKLTGNPNGITILLRMGIGQLLTLSTMVIAALVEEKRVRFARETHDKLSVWWLLPQYSVLGLAEVFILVGMQQFFYERMPERLRSLGAAAYLGVIGIGSFISSAIIEIVQMASKNKWLVNDLDKAHLDGFYWVLAGLCGLAFCGYIWVAKGFEDVVDDTNERREKELQEI